VAGVTGGHDDIGPAALCALKDAGPTDDRERCLDAEWVAEGLGRSRSQLDLPGKQTVPVSISTRLLPSASVIVRRSTTSAHEVSGSKFSKLTTSVSEVASPNPVMVPVPQNENSSVVGHGWAVARPNPSLNRASKAWVVAAIAGDATTSDTSNRHRTSANLRIAYLPFTRPGHARSRAAISRTVKGEAPRHARRELAGLPRFSRGSG